MGSGWALMAVLLVVGLMNLAWMAAIAVVFFAEKNWRHRRVAGAHRRWRIGRARNCGDGGACRIGYDLRVTAAGSWPGQISAITLFVEDLDAAKKFYREAFGLPVAFEDRESAVFKFKNTLINLLRSTAARGLIEPAAVGSREAGARAQFTIEVDDVDAMCAELTSRGVELLNGPMDRPWGVRTASFKDPAGHIWEIAM